MNSLKIITSETKERSGACTFRPKTNREQTQAHFETMWHRSPKKFDSQKNCMERERLSRTLSLIDIACDVKNMKIVDLGCGTGILSLTLKEKGAHVTSVDIAKNALEKLRRKGVEGIELVHDCIPHTRLEDRQFDIVVCTDLIAHLQAKDHRLLISELGRLVKSDGYIICSTPIDIDSEDALEGFAALMDTELTLVNWKFSYHRYYIKTLSFFKCPLRYARARNEKDYREREISRRTFLAKFWFKMHSAPFFGDIWNCLSPLSKFIYERLAQSHSYMLMLEKFCHFISNEAGISHVIAVAQQRPITPIEK